MDMKMAVSDLLVDTFARFYKIQQYQNKFQNLDTDEEVYSDFGAYIFIPKKLEDGGGSRSVLSEQMATMGAVLVLSPCLHGL